MGVTGDFKGLEDLRRKMAAVANGSLRRDVNKVCAEAAVKVLDDEFRSSTDPYGKPWAPLALREGKPLLDTGAHLRNSLAPHVTPTGFTVSTAFKGAAVHQYGATIRAKSRNGLVFRAKTNVRTTLARGKIGPLKKAVQNYQWIRKMQVTIPRRQYMPEGELGPKWEPALNAAATKALWDAMGADY